MKYALAIYGAPASSQAGQTALNFAKAVIARNHSISRLFFYQDGVHNATSLSAPPQDEVNLPQAWLILLKPTSWIALFVLQLHCAGALLIAARPNAMNVLRTTFQSLSSYQG